MPAACVRLQGRPCSGCAPIHGQSNWTACSGVSAIVVATTDKCYENREWEFAYRETDGRSAPDDDLIARLDGNGCDIKDMLHSELGPYGHVRFNLNGDRLYLPAKLAVSLLKLHRLNADVGALRSAGGGPPLDEDVDGRGDKSDMVCKLHRQVGCERV